MLTMSFLKNALKGRFFMPANFLLFCFTSFNVFSNENCVSTHFDEEVYIKKVIDGDTIILNDERHVRLIGIDTPEIFHDGRDAQPKAIEARDFLRSMLQENKRIKLRYDAEPVDKYKRTLAHLYLANGENVQAKILAKGLAVPLNIPPSIELADCYQSKSQQARKQNLGLWSLKNYQPIDVKDLSNQDSGFRIIRGKVERVNESRSSIWINMENNVAIRIVKSDLKYFDIKQIATFPGQHIEAIGKLYFRNKQHRIRIRYPLDFTIIHND